MTPQYQTPEKIELKFNAIIEPEDFWTGKKVLDIGCNEGLLLPLLELQEIGSYTGIDTSKEYIELAKKNFPEADFRLMNLFDWKEKVDIAISLSTFHILDYPEFEKAIEHYSKLSTVLIMEYPVKGSSPIYHTRTEEQTYKIVDKYFKHCLCYGISPSPHDPKSTRKVFKCY